MQSHIGKIFFFHRIPFATPEKGPIYQVMLLFLWLEPCRLPAPVVIWSNTQIRSIYVIFPFHMLFGMLHTQSKSSKRRNHALHGKIALEMVLMRLFKDLQQF